MTAEKILSPDLKLKNVVTGFKPVIL